VQIKSKDQFFYQTGLHGVFKDTLLYLTSSLQKSIGIYNLNTNNMVLKRTQEYYAELANKDCMRTRFPRLEGDYFYATFENQYDVYLAQFNSSTLELIKVTALETPDISHSSFGGYTIIWFGRFLTIKSNEEIVFVDFRTGKAEGKVRY
jgi:hypothetical protein